MSGSHHPDSDGATRLLKPGRTCWRIERANRLAVIVDAAEYFAVARAAMCNAQHTIMLIGWDFDTRIKLDPDSEDKRIPEKLGKFLNWLVAHNPGLNVYVLKWDLGLLYSLGRGTTPLFILDWTTNKRIHFRLDGAHPAAAAHHQKIVVIDDALAFCGGIDMTADRWDTRDHTDDDPHRMRPSGREYAPWHDVTTAADGGVACALGDLARERWRRATGEKLEPPPADSDPWPDRLTPTFENADVAIARTIPEYEEQAERREIEALYLAGIQAAKRSIYFESQYFASRKIAEAIAECLREPEGPEIVVVNPESTDGWLEEAVMGAARHRLMAHVKRADRGDRFGIYNPFTRGGQPIYVHAKVMIVDDRLLRVGSSNLNNRSMGFDTECDLAIEAVEGTESEDKIRKTIAGLRDNLLAEHLGATDSDVADAVASSNSFIAAIEALRGDGRSLRRLVPPEKADIEEALSESDLLDPEQPPSLRSRSKTFLIGLAKRWKL